MNMTHYLHVDDRLETLRAPAHFLILLHSLIVIKVFSVNLLQNKPVLVEENFLLVLSWDINRLTFKIS